MKKILLPAFILLSLSGFSQMATSGKQDIQIGILRDIDGGISSLATGSGASTLAVTPTSSVIGVSAGTITAGAIRVDFLTNSAFTGSINGAAWLGNTSISFPNINARTYPAIIYTVTTGSFNINVIR